MREVKKGQKGTVKFFNLTKGFGYITNADGTVHYVHRDGVYGSDLSGLMEGQEVSYDLKPVDADKWTAVNIKVLSGPEFPAEPALVSEVEFTGIVTVTDPNRGYWIIKEADSDGTTKLSAVEFSRSRLRTLRRKQQVKFFLLQNPDDPEWPQAGRVRVIES